MFRLFVSIVMRYLRACVKISCGKRAHIRRGGSAIDAVTRTQSANNSGCHYKKGNFTCAEKPKRRRGPHSACRPRQCLNLSTLRTPPINLTAKDGERQRFIPHPEKPLFRRTVIRSDVYEKFVRSAHPYPSQQISD